MALETTPPPELWPGRSDIEMLYKGAWYAATVVSVWKQTQAAYGKPTGRRKMPTRKAGDCIYYCSVKTATRRFSKLRVKDRIRLAKSCEAR